MKKLTDVRKMFNICCKHMGLKSYLTISKIDLWELRYANKTSSQPNVGI